MGKRPWNHEKKESKFDNFGMFPGKNHLKNTPNLSLPRKRSQDFSPMLRGIWQKISLFLPQ